MSTADNSSKADILGLLRGIVACGATGFLLAIVYLVVLRKVVGIGQGMGGLALAGSLFLFPIVAAVMGPLVWIALSVWRKSKGRSMNAGLAIGAGAVVGLLVGLVFAGGPGFKLSGGAPAFNYAFTAIGALGTLVFHTFARKAL